jgi:hypothetical protein
MTNWRSSRRATAGARISCRRHKPDWPQLQPAIFTPHCTSGECALHSCMRAPRETGCDVVPCCGIHTAALTLRSRPRTRSRPTSQSSGSTWRRSRRG